MASTAIKHLLFTGVLLSLSVYHTPSYAKNFQHSNYRGDFYLGLGGNYTQLLIDEAEFNPSVIRLRAGIFLFENIAIELQIGKGAQSDSPFHSLDIEIDQLQAIYGRLQSPAPRGFRVYFQAGYTHTQLLRIETDSGREIKNNFKGLSYSIGIEEQLKFYKPLYIYLEANSVLNDDIDLRSANAGIRYSF